MTAKFLSTLGAVGIEVISATARVAIPMCFQDVVGACLVGHTILIGLYETTKSLSRPSQVLDNTEFFP